MAGRRLFCLWSVQPLRDGRGPFTRGCQSAPRGGLIHAFLSSENTFEAAPSLDTEFVPSLTSACTVSFNHNSSPAGHSKVIIEPDLMRTVCVVENTLTFPKQEARSGRQPLLEALLRLWQGSCLCCAVAGCKQAGRRSCVNGMNT